MSAGKKESTIENTVDKHLEDYERELNDIVDKIGISYVQDSVSIETLKLGYKQLVSMDQQECCILSFKLAQYALYIQSQYNRLNNIKNWATQCLEHLVGKHAKNYGTTYTKYEEKKAYVISENNYAEALAKLVLRSHGKAQELYGVSQKIGNMSNVLLELSKSKRSKTNG